MVSSAYHLPCATFAKFSAEFGLTPATTLSAQAERKKRPRDDGKATGRSRAGDLLDRSSKPLCGCRRGELSGENGSSISILTI
jgi:hypothetical protein